MITFQNWDQLWQAIFMVVGTAAVGVIGVFAKQVSSFVSAKISTVKDDQTRVGLQAAQAEVEHVANLVVTSLNQTVANSLRSQGNGSLSLQAAKLVKDKALTEIQQLLSDEAHLVFEKHNIDITNFISHQIERVVADQNRWNGYSTPVSSEPAEPIPTPEQPKEDPEPTNDASPAAQ